MNGIFINCKDTDFIARILCGSKTLETRNKNTLKAFVGERVALIETGRGRQILRGYATISASEKLGYEDFRFYDRFHAVPYGSKYYCKRNGHKWAYSLINVEYCKPVVLPPYHGKSRVYRDLGELA